jgi:restriction system protein
LCEIFRQRGHDAIHTLQLPLQNKTPGRLVNELSFIEQRVVVTKDSDLLAGQGVTKGIFITTSYFTDTAEEFVQRGAHTKIVLIDGKDLINRMLRHKTGVRVARAIDIFELDQNYFEEP